MMNIYTYININSNPTLNIKLKIETKACPKRVIFLYHILLINNMIIQKKKL